MMHVLCLTSNAYVRCLPAFAACFNRWQSPRLDVTVVYGDVAPPPLPGNFYPVSVGVQAETPWSDGLLAALARFDPDELVLLLLDDYWLAAPVDKYRLAVLAMGMSADAAVGKIDLSGDRLRFPHKTAVYWGQSVVVALTDKKLYQPILGGFKSRLFLASLQAALWRVGFLRDALRPGESAWDFEERGTRRLLDSTEGAILGVRDPVLLYSNATKAGKPDLLRVEKLMPGQFEWLRDLGLLHSWGFEPVDGGV